MKSKISILLVLVLISCAPVYVNYDYEKSVDFSQYKTYNYYSNMDIGLNEIDSRRLMNLLDKKLSSKGLNLSETPDFYINIKSQELMNVQQNSVGVGIGSTGRNFGGGISMGIPIGQKNVNREFIIDFVDENKTGLFWHANIETKFNPNTSPETKEERFNTILNKVFEGYPPI